MEQVFGPLEEGLYEFVGWVPCLSGHLVFDFLEPGMGKNKMKVACEDDASSWLLYAEQDWKDTPSENSGKASVVMLAQKIDEDILSGVVCIAPAALAAKRWQQSMAATPPSDIDFFANQFPDLVTKVYFKLHSSGLTLVGAEKREGVTEETRVTLQRQAFYFIKYSIHQHKHHPKSTDSITTVESIDWSQPGASIAALVDQLVRSLIELKRHYAALGRSGSRHLGILAYTKSLIESLASLGLMPEGEKSSRLSYLSNFKDSFVVIAEERERKRSKKHGAITLSVQLVSLILAAFFAFTIIYLNIHSHGQPLESAASNNLIRPPYLVLEFFSSYWSIGYWFALLIGMATLFYVYSLGWFGSLVRYHARSMIGAGSLSAIAVSVHAIIGLLVAALGFALAAMPFIN